MKKNIILLVVAIVTFLSLITFATYAYFQVGTLTVTNVANSNTVTERNNMTFITIGGGMNLNIALSTMTNTSAGTVAASNSTTLKVEFTANTSYNIVCTYDIVYEWTSDTTNRYTAHSSKVGVNEFTVQATLASNTHVNEGINHIKNETDLADAVSSSTSATVVRGAQIDGTGTTKSTATWTINSKFYNVNGDQSTHAGKTFAAKFKVANVSCVAGSLNTTNTLVKYLINTSTKSGTDTVASAPWSLMMYKPEEWRYIGKNPNNYITFNGEKWRIVGIIRKSYCTGTVTDTSCSASKTDSLIKIVRNQSEGTMAWDTNGTNNWVNSSLKTTLQSKTYASDSHVVSASWRLYGYTSAGRTVNQFWGYNYSSGGAVATGNPTVWYGKVGVIFTSDYGLAAYGNGSTAASSYTRTGCRSAANMSSWTSSYKTYCVTNDWLWYNNVSTSTFPSAGVAWWTLEQISGAATNVISITAAGITASSAATTATINVRPAVYLKPDTLVSGTHTGTYADPYVIS